MSQKSSGFCEELASFIFADDRPPILFAGAGVAAKAGLPIWKDYITTLAEQVRPHSQLTRHQMIERLGRNDYTGAAEYYFICKDFPQADKYRALREPLEQPDVSHILALSKLPFKYYVTTNYDRSLFNAYARVTGNSPQEVNLGDSTLASAPFNTNFYIARVHGRIEAPETMVLSDSHYAKLQRDDHYVDYLRILFTQERIVFIGFSFLDPAIQNILHTVDANVGRWHNGRHVAILPNDTSSDFVRELELFNIKRIVYSSENNHSLLWECIDNLSPGPVIEKKGPSISQSDPFSLASQYLAACYARTSIGAGILPLRTAIVEGIVAAILQDAAGEGIEVGVIKEEVMNALSIHADDAQHLLSVALDALERDGLCKITGEGIDGKVMWQGGEQESFSAAIEQLVSSAVNRYVVRGSGKDTPAIRHCLKKVFETMILRRGWDLGAAFASNTPPDSIDVTQIMANEESCVAINQYRVGLARGVHDLVTKPNTMEAEILANLGRASFALEMVLKAPKDTLFHAATLPSCIYLDANVLMPAVTEGHPYHDVYRSTISRLISAAAESLVDVEVVAYEGYLNEVVSHRKLAIDELINMNKEDVSNLRKEAMFYGTENLNVFVGAYANKLATNKKLKFNEFLSLYAPYETEKSLAKWLQEKGITVKNEIQMKAGAKTYPEILNKLEKANAEGYWRVKRGIVVMHDAVQLGALARDIDNGKRSIFVSADRRLRDNIVEQKLGALSQVMISHVGLAQLIDLLVGSRVEKRGLSKLLWSAKISSNSERLREYFINLALQKYDAGMAMEMNKLVDDIAEDAAFAFDDKQIDINADSTKSRGDVMKLIEQFEERFYELMRQEMDSRREK